MEHLTSNEASRVRHSRTLTLKRKTLDADAPYASPLNAEQLRKLGTANNNSI
ncbi:hypothetical protein QUB21_17700 [Microcoleus sp. AT9b-C4]